MISDPYELARSFGCDDATATKLQTLLEEDRTGWKATWVERLNDPWWLEVVADRVPGYLDPDKMAWIIASRERSLDPFDPDTMRIRAWVAAAEAGGEWETVEIATGEVVARGFTPGSREGAAHRN